MCDNWSSTGGKCRSYTSIPKVVSITALKLIFQTDLFEAGTWITYRTPDQVNVDLIWEITFYLTFVLYRWWNHKTRARIHNEYAWSRPDKSWSYKQEEQATPLITKVTGQMFRELANIAAAPGQGLRFAGTVHTAQSSSSSKSLLYVTFRHKRYFKWHYNTIKTL